MIDNPPIVELDYISAVKYNNAFMDVELTVEVLHVSTQTKWNIPAFWDGKNLWKVRIYTPYKGLYETVSVSSNPEDKGLHGIQKSFQVEEQSLNHPLYIHGNLLTCKDKFIYEDGMPFFWFGDTWWMGFCDRLQEEEFELLLADRKIKGFNVIQLVAGLFPDMDSFDERGKNEGGFAWKEDYITINPKFFQYADRRVQKIVDAGIHPFIFGAWGYYLLKMSEKKMRLHWRYLIARWGAYPVIWSLAGEMSMPWYLSTKREQEHRLLKEGWDNIARYIKKIDPYQRLLSSHPVEYSYKEVKDSSLLDFEMLQAGHSDKASVKKAIVMIDEAKKLFVDKPIVMDEIAYEGILGKNKDEIQRMAFWISFLRGINGFTYGANGIWQVNQQAKPFGKSPSGDNWGETSWQEAMNLAGGEEIAWSVAFLQKLPWNEFEIDQNFDHKLATPFCMNYKDEMKLLYCIDKDFLYRLRRVRLKGLQKRKQYYIYHFDPVVNSTKKIFTSKSNHKGEVKLLRKRFENDWILLVSLKELSL